MRLKIIAVSPSSVQGERSDVIGQVYSDYGEIGTFSFNAIDIDALDFEEGSEHQLTLSRIADIVV